jgi:hypothetical protein
LTRPLPGAFFLRPLKTLSDGAAALSPLPDTDGNLAVYLKKEYKFSFNFVSLI